MIITKSEPFTPDEIEQLKEVYQVYIKVVFDIQKKICSAGAGRHHDSERILIEQGSNKDDLWGGGLDVKTKQIDYSSFLNIRPSVSNLSNIIENSEVKYRFEELIKFFFQEIFKVELRTDSKLDH